MGWLKGTVFALYTLLAALAWLVARREPAHRPLALYITWMAAADWAKWGLHALRRGAPRPYAGLDRLSFHLDELFVLSWSFLFVACCVHYFLRRGPWMALGAWLATWLVCLNYPLVSGDVLAWIYRLVALGGLAASWGCIFSGMLRARDLDPGLAHLVLILYASADVVLSLVPYASGFFARWPLVQIANLLLLVAACGAHARRLRARGRALAAAA